MSDENRDPMQWFPTSMLDVIRREMQQPLLSPQQVRLTPQPAFSLSELAACGIMLLQKYLDDSGCLDVEAVLKDYPGAGPWLDGIASVPAA